MNKLQSDEGDKGEVRLVSMPELNENDAAFSPGPSSPAETPEPSTVPYSVIFQSPTPDISTKGRQQAYVKLALESLDNLENMLPLEGQGIKLVCRSARDLFDMGYHRFEILVGDWSLKIYKQPDPSHG